MKKTYIFLLLIILVISCQKETLKLTTSIPGKYKLAFISKNKGTQDIYLAELNGRLTNLTSDYAKETSFDFSPDGKFLVYSANKSGALNEDLYLISMSSLTKLSRRLTKYSGVDKEPSFAIRSPLIIFISTLFCDFGEAIFIIKPNGTNLTKITGIDTWATSFSPPWRKEEGEPSLYVSEPIIYYNRPSWHPVEDWITFSCYGGVENSWQIYFLDLNQIINHQLISNITLEQCSEDGKNLLGQKWSTFPDENSWILVVENGSGKILEIGKKEEDSTIQGETLLNLYASNTGSFVTGNYFKITIRFKDNTKISGLLCIGKTLPPPYFTHLTSLWLGMDKDITSPSSPTRDGYLDGHIQIKITLGPIRFWGSQLGASNMEPAFSPDGSKLLFVSNRAGSQDIYLANLKTREIEQITSDTSDKFNPAWCPDGNKIAFSSKEKDLFNSDIYILDLTNRSLLKLTENEGEDFWPIWYPVAEK